MDSIFKELRRRNVFRVAGVYAVVGWLVAQMAAIAFPAFEAPPWVLKSVIAIIIVGFPIAMILAWAFELTPEGVKRTATVDPDSSITSRTGQKLDIALLLGLVIIAILIIGDRIIPRQLATQGQPVAASGVPVVHDKSIAVLPFADLSPDGDQEYFAEGLSEELLNVLARINELKVAGRTSSFAFKGRNEDLREIGEALNVAHILEGSVRKSGNQIRVTAQLISTKDGYHLFSDTYEGDLEDIFEVQDEIAQKITTALKVELLGEEAPAEAAAPSSFAAYDLYLLARQRIYTRDKDKLEEAVELLDDAIAIDRDYAPAYAMKAIATLLLSDQDYGDIPMAEVFATAEPLIERAIALDPSLADGHAAMALLRSNQNAPLEEIARPARRALSINPTMAGPGIWLANAYRRDGRTAEALPIYEEVFNRDPLFRPAYTNIVAVYSGLGQYDKAEEALDRVERIEGKTPSTVAARMTIFMNQQKFGEAVLVIRDYPEEKWDKGLELAYGQLLIVLGEYDAAQPYASPDFRPFIDIFSGRPEAAHEKIAALPAPEPGDIDTLGLVLFMYHLLNDPEGAIAFFEEYYPGMDELAENVPVSPAWWGGILAWAYSATGDTEKGDHALQLAREAVVLRLQAPEANGGWAHMEDAIVKVQSGDREGALTALREAVDNGYMWPEGMSEPVFNDLRPDPRMDVIEGDMRRRVNEERAVVGLPPLETVRGDGG